MRYFPGISLFLGLAGAFKSQQPAAGKFRLLVGVNTTRVKAKEYMMQF